MRRRSKKKTVASTRAWQESIEQTRKKSAKAAKAAKEGPRTRIKCLHHRTVECFAVARVGIEVRHRLRHKAANPRQMRTYRIHNSLNLLPPLALFGATAQAAA